MNSVKDQKKVMAKPYIRTQWNRPYWDVKKETFTKPSMTIPDETLTIKEILQRYTSGQPIPGGKEPIYEGEEPTFPLNWEKLDLEEKMQYLNNARQALQDHEEETRKKIKESQEKLRQEEIDKAVQAKLKELEKSQGKTASPQGDQA